MSLFEISIEFETERAPIKLNGICFLFLLCVFFLEKKNGEKTQN